ncbi:MAG: molybdenum cofactor guanylyltransferase [Rhizobiaceae bacterium]|nr:molybdenum cofactor guanylyltransferase [Rhizobiaceae bacterium]
MGSDKSLGLLAGKPLIAHVEARLAPQVDLLAINANGGAQGIRLPGIEIVPDTIPDFAGPLAGILAGMIWAKRAGFEQLATVPTDSPFFPHTLVERLSEVGEAGTIAVASCVGKAHPVFALWPVNLADSVAAFLSSGAKASVMAFVTSRPHCFAAFDPIAYESQELDPFFNINTPADLDKAESMALDLLA